MPTNLIRFGQGQTGSIMTPLIPFNMIFDTDIGLLLTIRDKYLDPDVFQSDYFLKRSLSNIAYDLYMREEENPLYVICNDGYKHICDTLYSQFMEREYTRILDKCTLTGIYNFVCMCKEDMDIHPTIICSNEKEVKRMKKTKGLDGIPVITEDEMNPSVMNSYNQYFFKSLPDAIPYSKYIKRKTVYFGGWRYNFDKDTGFKNHPVVAILSLNNRLAYIDAYSYNDNELKGDEDGSV